MSSKIFENLRNEKISYYIFSLGNPGAKYSRNRHNIGTIFLHESANDLKINLNENKLCKYFVYQCVNPNKNKKLPPTKILLAEPITFMNTQGDMIKKIMSALNPTYSINQIKIICDDLETDIGKVKFSKTGGDRGHNGLKSIQKAFSSNDYEKIKIGIGRPNSKDPDEVANYVLGNFPDVLFKCNSKEKNKACLLKEKLL